MAVKSIDRRIPQPKIRAEIDDAQATIQESAGDFRRDAVGQMPGTRPRFRCGGGNGIGIRFHEGEIRPLGYGHWRGKPMTMACRFLVVRSYYEFHPEGVG
jgi:hypothetical protein